MLSRARVRGSGWAARRIAGRAVALGLAGLVASCGPPSEMGGLEVGFRRHDLTCEVKDIEVKLQIEGIDGFCPLEIDPADHTVSGRCPDVPTGTVRSFRLVYFILLDVEVELATAIAMLDLRGETRRTITLEFSTDQLETSFDDDGDRVTNLVEVCTNRNPLLFDQ